MPRAKGSRGPQPPRWDTVYSTEVATPHVKWAQPYVQGPIRAFIISSVHEGRTVAELMQRLTLDPRVVSIDPNWDVNRWTLERYYSDFEDREPRDYEPVYRVLEEEITARARYDTIVMHSGLGWNHLPAKVRAAIEARVRGGEGLVLVHPQLGEDESDQSLWQLSPIAGVPATKLTSPGAGIDSGYPQIPRMAISGRPWRKVAEHYLSAGIPFEALPYPALKHYRYRLAEGATAVVVGEGDSPVVAVREYGRGRVVGVGYHNYGLFPELEARRGEPVENCWEYLFSLLMRAIIWSAGKEPRVLLRAVEPSATRFTPERAGGVRLVLANSGAPSSVRVAVTFRDEQRQAEGEAVRTVRLGRGETEVRLPLPEGPAASGRHFVEAIVTAGGQKQDWGAASYLVRARARVSKVMPDAGAVAAGGVLTGRARLAGEMRGLTLVAELWDQTGRLLAQQTVTCTGRKEVRWRLTCPEALTNLGWVKCVLKEGERFVSEARAQVALTAPRRTWEDYEVVLPWLHKGVWPWTDAIEEQYRRLGITSTSDPQWNFPLTVSMHPPGFGVYWFRRHPYLERKRLYQETGGRKYLARVPCIHSDEFRRPVAQALRKGIPPILKYSPLAYYIADESSITCYEDAFDLCWSDATLAAFRAWLRRQYRTLEALNAEWDTSFRTWDEVMPVTWDEAQRRGNPAPWVDHRLFMNRTLASAFAYARDVARRVDPEGLVTVSGTQLPGSHNGCDWWEIDKIIEYLQPYDVGGQLEMHRSFNPAMIQTGFTGYSLFGPPLEHQVWHRFFHNHRGASIFWGYTLVDPDLKLNAQGRSFEKVFGELRGEGICRTIAGLRREHDGIAVHFSMASGHVWWIQDGKLTYEGMEYGQRTSPSFGRFIHNREGWTQVLEDIGYQYNYLAYEQLEKGELTRRGHRVLVLPGSIALSDKEVARIRAFVRAGGLLIADARPGLTDEHGKRRERGALDDLFAAARHGKGRAVLLERWLDGYPGVRLKADGEELRALVRGLLRGARLRPRARVEGEAGEHPVAVERVTWRGGQVEVVGLLRETEGEFRAAADGTLQYVVREGMAPSERVRVELPRAGHWCDLRSHRYLGEIAEVRTTLRGAEPRLYARLPYRVRGLSLALSAGGRGEAVSYQVQIKAGGARPSRHVVKIEVFAPDGKKPLYSRNVDTRAGLGKGEFRLALNDPIGEWRLVATDVFSGERAEKRWRVK